MATHNKIDPIRLNELISEGKGTSEIAKHFKCSPSAVSQAKRKLGIAVVGVSARRRNAARDAAPLIVNNDEEARRQLGSVVSRLSDELGWIEASIEKTTDENYRDWLDTTRKHIAEIRKSISAMADIEFKMHHVNNVQRALLIMYEEIGHENEECKKRIRDRFNRSAIAFLLDEQ
jgi:hypothetical protein